VSAVLIVDDEPAIREVLKRWLSAAGYDTREAPDADAAVDLLNASISDVIVCDIQMPGHDGVWLVAQVRERFPSVAIVLATGVDNVPPVTSLRSGVVEYLLKPFAREQVLVAVRRAVKWQKTSAAREPRPGGTHDPIADWMNARRSGARPPE
jgi:putative two-component system response regulator